MINRWAWGDSDIPKSKRFAAIDPGDKGAVVIMQVGQDEPLCIIPSATRAAEIAGMLNSYDCRVLITETQFIGANPQSALELAFRSGLVLGEISTRVMLLDLIEVHPSTWQAAQRRRNGVSGRLQRAEGIELAKREAGACIDAFPTGAREGIASALGIARSYLDAHPHLTEPQA